MRVDRSLCWERWEQKMLLLLDELEEQKAAQEEQQVRGMSTAILQSWSSAHAAFGGCHQFS